MSFQAPRFVHSIRSCEAEFDNLTASNASLTFADDSISGDKVEGGTINATTVNTLTVPTQLDVTGATLVLDNDSISGDKVEGGTINATTINTLTVPTQLDVTGATVIGLSAPVSYGMWTLSTPTTLTTATLEEIVWDTDTAGPLQAQMDNGTGEFTVPATGRYKVEVYIEFENVGGGTGQREIQILTNGTPVAHKDWFVSNAADQHGYLSYPVQHTVGQVITVQVRQHTGVDQDIDIGDTYLMITQL